ncbi:class I SAM-dependent methyltransferase [Hydrogenimonas thermophila]|uniref:class I SAM-dependent methyltransferase n=1 Tax=Hydrogenimonas thermophila TaxID=223786 RepID=UPI0029373AA8|nr:class I SAM-dependent methyltransferase [Hydrogenimonas thermophila]WOE70034.1 class I SAM-dependent methyltransferase [Hydrogenimonas thermophila]WOE72551.1 class I SAM-dependent methyltransferase [Hydrogenimonas thermophila]
MKQIIEFISYKIIPIITLDIYAPNVSLWNMNFLNWYYLKKYMKKASKKYINGICLDIGSGNSPYKRYLKVDKYISIDKKETQAVAYKQNEHQIEADIKKLPFDNNYADTVLLNQVLEHIDDYEQALSEVHRVLKKDGTFVISVPFIYHIHSEPNDYFRFSEYGLKYILEKHNFRIMEFHYLGYIGTTLVSIWNSFLWQTWNKNIQLKFLRNTVFLIPLLLLFFLNNILGLILDLFQHKKFCPNYLVIARKI